MVAPGKKRTSPSRAERSTSMDQVVLSAALHLFSTAGVDSTTIALVAKEVGASVGAVYSRYESVDDLISGVWDTILEPCFDELLEEIRTCFNGNDPKALEHLAARLSKPSVQLNALVEILAVVRRYPISADYIRSRVTSQLKHHVEKSSYPAGLAIPEVSMIVGALLLQPVLPRRDQESAAAYLKLLAQAHEGSAYLNYPPVEATPVLLPWPEVDTGNPTKDLFMKAAYQVIARTGFEKASTNRIARVAGKGFSGVYKDFHSKDEFMESAASDLIFQLFSTVVVPFIGITEEEYVFRSMRNVRSLNSDENRLARQLRLECIVAARHHPSIKRALRKGFATTAEMLHKLIAQHFNMTSSTDLQIADALWLLIRVNNVGMPLLAANTALLETVDWTPGSHALYGLITRYGFQVQAG